MDINQPLDQAQIADAVNRQKVGTQRQRNEMMRLGTSDPNSFAMQNQKQLQDAQQPAEFWGAGRKIAEDQNPDLDAANTINPLVKLGGIYNYYGDTDSSSAKWGTPYGKTDIGGGKYNILGSQGQTLGTGYKSLQESISEMYKSANAPTAVSKWKDYTGSLDRSLYDTVQDEQGGWTQQGAINQQRLTDAGYRLNPNYQPARYNEGGWLEGNAVGSQYQKLFNGYDWKGSDYDTLDQANAARDTTAGSYYTGNNIRDWENLGQLLTQGNITGDVPNRIGSLGGNQIADQISGLNTLYGSTPLIFKDQLYGYKNAYGDTTPIQTSWDFGDSNAGKYANERNQYWGNAGLGREYSNPDWWSQNTKNLKNGNYFVSADKAVQNPGWLNKDYYNAQELHQSVSNGKSGGGKGLFGGIFSFLDPILDTLDPLHNPTQDFVTDTFGFDSQEQAFSTIAPIVLSVLAMGADGGALSAGSAGSGVTAGAGSTGAGLAAGTGAGITAGSTGAGLTAGAGLAGAGSAAGALGTGLSWGQIAAGVNALNSASTGNWGGALSGALGASGMDLGLGNLGNSALRGALGAGIDSALAKDASTGGTFQAALLGGLGGLAGPTVSNATSGLGSGLSQFFGGAAQGAVGSAGKGSNAMINSALTSGVGRGLGGLFNDVSGTTDKKQQQQNIQAGQQAAKLAQLFRNNNGGKTTTGRKT